MKEADLFRQYAKEAAGPPCPARFAVQSYLVGESNSPQATIGHAHFFVGLSFAVVGWAIVVAAYRIERERQKRNLERFGLHF